MEPTYKLRPTDIYLLLFLVRSGMSNVDYLYRYNYILAKLPMERG